MSVILPRLDRDAAIEIIERHAGSDVETVGRAMPDLPEVVTYAQVDGLRVENSETAFVDLRSALLAIAVEHGWPGSLENRAEFEGRSARLLHERLPMTPHEASHDDVWSYVTCCWLLDIAMWRFGPEADVKRFLGDLNRNTFRRMWWRAEVLGPDIVLTDLREDELVSIMERPTLASDRRLARSMAREFLGRAARGEVPERMKLMRESSKRLLRLTPFVAFGSLSDVELTEVVAGAFEGAAASIDGRAPVLASPPAPAVPRPSPEVSEITSMVIPREDPTGGATADGQREPSDLDTIAQVAIDLARSTGRVTNITLRNVAHITADEARDVFKQLISEGKLVRRGEKRGTHYLLPVVPTDAEPDAVVESVAEDVPSAPETPVANTSPSGPSDSALRRLLRRGR